MYLFAHVIAPVTKALSIKYPDSTLAFADDGLIGLRQNESVDEAINFISPLFKDLGLEINASKCYCTRQHAI